jgi:DNA-directed RNA polymerase subunit RPC12/RpoP
VSVAQILCTADVGSTVLGVLIVAGIVLGILSYIVRSATDVATTLKPGATSTGGRCPFCGKSIKAGMYVCHHCGQDKRTEVRTRRVKCPSCQKRVNVKGAMGQAFKCPHCQQSATLTS